MHASVMRSIFFRFRFLVTATQHILCGRGVFPWLSVVFFSACFSRVVEGLYCCAVPRSGLDGFCARVYVLYCMRRVCADGKGNCVWNMTFWYN